MNTKFPFLFISSLLIAGLMTSTVHAREFDLTGIVFDKPQEYEEAFIVVEIAASDNLAGRLVVLTEPDCENCGVPYLYTADLMFDHAETGEVFDYRTLPNYPGARATVHTNEVDTVTKIRLLAEPRR